MLPPAPVSPLQPGNAASALETAVHAEQFSSLHNSVNFHKYCFCGIQGWGFFSIYLFIYFDRKVPPVLDKHARLYPLMLLQLTKVWFEFFSCA